MAAQQLDDGNEDGCIVGRATGKVAFYGGTPAVKTSVTHTVAATTAAVFSAAATGMWAYASSTVAQARDLAIVEMSAAVIQLKALGII